MSATDHNSWSLDCKVYIGGLGEGADKDEISSACSHYGEIKNLWVARNPPGFAFVEFTDPRDAQDAVYALHGTRFNGRRIKVEMSTGKTKTVKSSSELMRYSSRSLTRSRSRSRSIYSDRSRSYRHDRRHSRSYTPDSQYSYRSRSRSRSYFRSRSRSISSMSDYSDKYYRKRRRRRRHRSRSSDFSDYSSSSLQYRRSRSRSIDQGEGHHRRSYRGKRSHRAERRSEAHASPRQVAENVTSDSPRGLCETEVTREKPKGDIHSESVGVQTDFYLLLHFVQKSPQYLKENFLRLDRDNVLHNSEHMEIIPSKYQRQRIANGTTQSSSTKHSHKKLKSSSGTSHKKPSKVSSQDQKQDIDIFDKEEQSKEKVSLNADLLDIPTPDDDGNHVLGNSSRAKVVVNFTPISVKKADLKKNGLSVDKSPKNDKNQDDTKSTKMKKKAKSSENNKDGITKDSKKRAPNKDKHSKNVIYNNNNLEKPIQLYSSSEDHPETGAKRSPSKFERISLNRNNDSEDEEMGSTAERKLKDTQ